MEEIKAPKKERKFLKAIGNIGKVLVEELVMGIARKFIGKAIDKVGNKKQGLVIAFIVLASSFVFAQFPTNTNKQRLGFQTTADGIVWRGSISDTAAIQPTTNQNAWLIIDTVNLKIYSFDFTSNVWGLVGGGGGLTMPFDSITFNTAKDGTVGVGEVEFNDTQGSLIQGLKGGNVTNVIGQQLHQRVNNRTGSTLTKGTAVYLSGSQGNRITVAKALAVTDAFSANTFGIVAESIADNQSGYVITEGLITGINTSALVEDSAVYLSPTVAGGLTSTKPQAPQHTVYIGVCVKSNAGSGELFVKIRNGQELDELHDVSITSPVNKASLYYLSSQGIWRDTTPTLLVSDTAAMLANYATKAYADTSGRFYARQDFTNVSSSTLTWTQSDTLVVGGVNVVQVYRNGQILLPTQYTIPTNASVVIGATAYKVGENYTVIFPRGGGAGSGGGSGSLTSISGGTGIIVNPNPITTTGTVSADLSVLMELTDTSLLNLTSRFATKLNAADTASLSTRIDTKGTGTVTSVGSGFGLLGGTITTTGTLRLDSATVFNRIRDSIVDVAIGNDTIKILKQEYNAASSSILTWTITPKFPIQLKAYILVFRNGQLLNNDQYNLTDTNKITIVSTSFKIGANYTVATVSGIGSVGSAQAGNPVYPEAGIALSTGTTWASSIPNNSSNWNTAFTDRLKWDGGSTDLVPSTGRTSLGGTTIGQSMFTLTNPFAITFPRFNADNTVSALTAANFRSAIGAGTVTTVNAATTAGNPISINNNTTTPTIELLSATSARNGYLTSTDWTTFNNKQSALGFTPANSTINIATTAPLQGGGNLTANRTLSITQATTSANGFLTSTDWNTFNGKQNTLVSGTTIKTVNGNTLLGSGNLSVGTLVGADTVSLSNRINLKVNISDTSAMLLPYLRKADTTLMLLPYFRDNDTTLLNLSSRFNTKLNLSDTANMLLPYLRKADTTSMLLPYFKKSDTTQLNLTSRFASKQNTLNGTGFVKASGTNITYDNSSYLRTSLADSSYLKLTGGTLTGALNVNGTSTLNFTNVYGKNTYVPFNVGIGEQSILNVGAYLRGGTVMLFPDSNLVSSSANLFLANSNVLGVEFSAFGSGLRNYSKQGGDNKRNSLALYTSDIGQQNTNRLYINYNGDIGINDDTPSYKLDVNGTFNATGNSLIGGTLGVIGNILFGSKSVYSGQYTRYLQSSETSPYRDLFIGSLGTIGTWAGRMHFQTSYNTETPTTAMTINEFGNINMNGTLGVTGAATLSSTLAVTGDITESGNNVLTNLDTVSLSNRINGKVGLTGNESISGTKTFNNLVNLSSNLILSGSYSSTNKLLGKNSSDGVGNITVGSGLNLTSDILTATNPTERYYFDLGTVAGQADNVTGTYNFSYSGNAFIVPSSLNGYCIDTVNIRAISCTNCPPAAGEKDYYMGVYKVSAGNRVTSTGATMQGSQIVCNEYDLKEENVNHVLTTGDVWWVYLNGSYFSDMEIIKASFIVKKTCN